MFAVIILVCVRISNNIISVIYIIDIFKSINKKIYFINNKEDNIKKLTLKYEKALCCVEKL